MAKLSEIVKGTFVHGLDGTGPVKVIDANILGDSLAVFYQTQSGEPKSQVLSEKDAEKLRVDVTYRRWPFSAKSDDFRLAIEAHRISLAHLFDPYMAVHTSNIEPLPHQITAVYENLLSRQPLRYLLADDPGAGKTIMAGLFMRELMLRADLKRAIIVAPGGLVEQWQDELLEKFKLNFRILGREDVINAPLNPFLDDANALLIVRLDQLARNEDLLAKLRSLPEQFFDLVIVDEAHKMSATWDGQDVRPTHRYTLGELLGEKTHHFLLMTATPHNGKPQEFRLFMRLIDKDRFEGKPRADEKTTDDARDLMRRMCKEDLVRFDGRPLFPERRAETASYTLSDPEKQLYEHVTEYVQQEMDRADKLKDKKRGGNIGFALAALQRRLASSPLAIFRSLERRHKKLENKLAEAKSIGSLQPTTASSYAEEDTTDFYDDEVVDEEDEQLEEELAAEMTAAVNMPELEAEIVKVRELETEAKSLYESRKDSKWRELSELLQNPRMTMPDGRKRKLLVFTESKDTLDYLKGRISEVVGEQAVDCIFGGTPRDIRRDIQERFRNDPTLLVLIATDAAGEGVNLQKATNIMANYDLPWNPNRLEQRFGRIHRIGQKEICFMWNLVAKDTREGQVFERLLQKLENIGAAMGGKVFNVLGELFEDEPFYKILESAIRYGDDPVVRENAQRKVDGAFDEVRVRQLLEERRLDSESLPDDKIVKVREEMEKAEARKLQPYFVRQFFKEAFRRVGGELRDVSAGRWRIPNVPGSVIERARENRRAGAGPQSVSPRYDVVCFDKVDIDRDGHPQAELLHPGHPLVQAVLDLTKDAYAEAIKSGAVMQDPNSDGTEPYLLLAFQHEIRSADGRVVSRQWKFAKRWQDGRVEDAGWAPHLDLQPITIPAKITSLLEADWLKIDPAEVAMGWAASNFAAKHFEDVRKRKEDLSDRMARAVDERLKKEIQHWDKKAVERREKDSPLPNILDAENRRDSLKERLRHRLQEIANSRELKNGIPVVQSAAYVVPAGLLAKVVGGSAAMTQPDAADRKVIELKAMTAVMEAEKSVGRLALDVSAENCGWDITSRNPNEPGDVLHIEVKGRAAGQDSVTVTKNEMLAGLNQADLFRLAIVFVDGDGIDGPHYIKNPFQGSQPGFADVSVNLSVPTLLRVATKSSK